MRRHDTTASQLASDDVVSSSLCPSTGENGTGTTIRIAVCLASFNRVKTTLAALECVKSSILPANAVLTTFLLDDASADGTATSVGRLFPDVRLLHGDGGLYWAGGMRAAFGAALAEGFDYYIWLNDDVVLERDAVARLIACSQKIAFKFPGHLHLVAGSLRDSKGATTYGAVARTSRLFPWKYRRLVPHSTEPLPCETVNGNLLLVSAALAGRLGNIDPVFRHSIGDFDYGLRAHGIGAGVWLAPGHYGVCSVETTSRQNWGQSNLSLKQRWDRIQHPLGLPFREHWTYSLRHYGVWGPVIGLGPYIRLLVRHALITARNVIRK